MKKVFYLLAAAVLLFAFVGCSDDDDAASLTVTGPSGSAVALDGNWAPPGGCAVFADESESFTQTIAASGISVVSNSYWNVADCSGTAQTTFAVSGAFVLGNDVSTTLSGAAVTASQMDFTFTSATLTPNEQEAVDGMAGFCGVATWTLGVAQDILGSDCVGTTEKDLLYVDDTVTPNRMYSGDDSGVDTTVAYPTVLSTDYLERQ